MAENINYWKETRNGIRGSTTMFAGVLLGAVSGLLHFILPFFFTLNTGTSDNLLSGIWLLWILGMWVLGIAFIWVGNQPYLTQFGIIVGIFHLLQGAFLLVALFSSAGPMAQHLLFTAGRLIALLVFGIIERPNIGVPLSIMIWVSSLLQLLKIALRVMGTLPEMSPLVQNSLDLTFLLLVCAVMVQLGRILQGLEDSWAREKYLVSSSGFADFNNPQHKWDQ